MPLVSVIIPSFNRPGLAYSAVRSVLGQSLRNIEVILVDDFSSIPYHEVIDKINDERLIYSRHEYNKGVSGARNTGLELARGDYVAFLDDDDIMIPNHLEKSLSNIESSCTSDVVIIGKQFKKLLGIYTECLPRNIKKYDGDLMHYRFSCRGIISMGSIVVSRKIALSVRFDEDQRRHEDIFFMAKLQKLMPKIVFSNHIAENANTDNTNQRLRGGLSKTELEDLICKAKQIMNDEAFIGYKATYQTPILVESRKYWSALRLLLFAVFSGKLHYISSIAVIFASIRRLRKT